MFSKTLTAISALALAATSANALVCADADRFGDSTYTPNTGLQPGSTLAISTNYACSFYFDITPTYAAYLVYVGPSADFQAPVFLAEHSLEAITEDQPWDNFTVTIPDAFWTANTAYPITTQVYYDETGPNGGSYLTQGGTEGITITISSTTPV